MNSNDLKAKKELITKFLSIHYPDGFVNQAKQNRSGNKNFKNRQFIWYQLLPFLYQNHIEYYHLIKLGSENKSLDLMVFGIIKLMEKVDEEDPRDLIGMFHEAYDALAKIHHEPKKIFGQNIIPYLRSYQKKYIQPILNKKKPILKGNVKSFALLNLIFLYHYHDKKLFVIYSDEKTNFFSYIALFAGFLTCFALIQVHYTLGNEYPNSEKKDLLLYGINNVDLSYYFKYVIISIGFTLVAIFNKENRELIIISIIVAVITLLLPIIHLWRLFI